MRHLVVFQAFFNVDHIKQSFQSMYMEGIDYFIVENKCKYSPEIEEYFSTRSLKGYIQFEENIGSNALNIFVRDHWAILKDYDYITITEGDLYIYDIHSMMEEIRMGLNMADVLVSAAGLYYGNTPDRDDRIIGCHHYEQFELRKRGERLGNGFGGGGIHMLTFTRNSIDVIRDVYMGDWSIYEAVNKVGKGVVTQKNKAYHLTWDLLNHQPETEYGRFRSDIDHEFDRLGTGGPFKTLAVSSYKRIV